jgi:hypothetical protein
MLKAPSAPTWGAHGEALYAADARRLPRFVVTMKVDVPLAVVSV